MRKITVYAGGTSHTYPPAWRLMWPVVTFQIKYPVGIVPLVGSAVTGAGRICIHVPGVPVSVRIHRPPRVKAPPQGAVTRAVRNPMARNELYGAEQSRIADRQYQL